MSTRAMIVISFYGNNSYELFYRHCDGYPSGLGVELLQALQGIREEIRLGVFNPNSVEQILKALRDRVKMEEEHKTVARPEDAFLKVQGDLEYVYAIENLDQIERTRIDIYKTSNPHTKVDFAFRIWGSYLCYAPQTLEHIAGRMELIEGMSNMILHGLAAYEKASSEREQSIEVHAQ